jgi:Cu+-exporting ATPase
MHCDGCAAGIKAMLKRTSGVISADVNYKQKEAIVHYDPEKVTREKIVEAITKLGYKAHVKR